MTTLGKDEPDDDELQEIEAGAGYLALEEVLCPVCEEPVNLMDANILGEQLVCPH